MGTSVLKCPLCCAETFTCRKYLSDHLLSLSNNLACPVCLIKFESLSDLICHLSEKNCSANDRKIKIGTARVKGPENLKTSKGSSDAENKLGANVRSTKELTPIKLDVDEINIRLNKQGEPLDHDLNHRVSLIGDDNESHILIVEQFDSDDDVEPSFVQHDDGTIVLTSDKSDNANHENIANEEDDPITTENGEDVYSCNSCSMSFTSVVEHIQKYHSDQEVVLQMTNDKLDLGSDDALAFLHMIDDKSLETDQIETDETIDDKTTKYVITDSGEIIQAQEDVKVSPNATAKVNKKVAKHVYPSSVREEVCVDKDGRQYLRKIIQIDKFWTADDKKFDEEQVLSNDGSRQTDGSSTRLVQIPKVIRGKLGLMLDVGAEPKTVEAQRHLVLYQCSTCSEPFTAAELKRHHCKNAIYKYVCSHCPVSYASSKSLCAHMKIHKEFKTQEKKAKQSDSNPPPFRCDICDTVFPTNKSLRLHGRMHEPLRVRQVDAPVFYSSSVKTESGDDANRAKLSADNLDGDKSESGDHKDMYLCAICDKWIHCGYRDIHDNFHASGNQFNCEICNRKFFTEENLMMHMNVHNNEKTISQPVDKLLPYKCLYCYRQFSRPHEKVKHERIHTGEKPHSCDICGKSFRVSYCLTLHMRTHTGARPYVCSHCGKRFKAHSVYNHHLLTHSDVRAYKCCFCPKAFKTSVQLAGHKNSHTKPFSCTLCNRPFASLYAVRVHMETHSRQNNLKYRCALCGASYARAFALKDHVKSVHGCEYVELNSAKELVMTDPAEASSSSFSPERDATTKTETEECIESISILPKSEGYIEAEEMDIGCTQELELLRESDDITYSKKSSIF